MSSIFRFFNFGQYQLRVLGNPESPWFVAKDVADVLGYSDTQAMTRKIKDGELSTCTDDSTGQVRTIVTISEAGLYIAILRSRKEEAENFQSWVTKEVLPSIRKDGAYVHSNEGDSDDVLMARALQAAQRTIERNKAKLEEARKELEAQRPAVEYCNEVLSAVNLHTINSVAVHLGISAIRLNKFLLVEGWIYKQGDIYYPSARIRNAGYCDYHLVPYLKSNGETATREHLKWTEKGRKAIIELWNKRFPKSAAPLPVENTPFVKVEQPTLF